MAAVVGQRHAVDVFHHEIRLTVRGVAAVEQARDIGMVEVGEDLPLAPHSIGRITGRDAAQQLDRDAPFERIVDALGEEHRAHAAAADLAHEAPGPEPLLQRRDRHARGRLAQSTGHAAVVAFLGRRERERFALERFVVVERSEQGGAPGGRCRDQCVEEFLQAAPARVAHAASFCFNQARAKRSSRSTVGTDTPTTSAISSRLRPRR